MLITLLVIVLLLLGNALYVAAEFGAVSVRRTRIRQLAEDGNAAARALLKHLHDARALDRYVAACQVGITLTSLILGAFGQARLAPLLAPWFEALGDAWRVRLAAESTSAVVVLLTLTVLQVVLAELVPKSLALQFPERAATSTLWPMQWSLAIYNPFIRLLNGSGNLILRLFGVDEAGHRHIHSPDEIELLIAESRDGGLLEPDEHQRLQRALRLGRRSVRELMVPRLDLVMLNADAPPDDALRQVLDSPFSRLPVYRDSRDDVIGVIDVKDVVAAVTATGQMPAVTTLMHPLLKVSETLTADRLLRHLREDRSHQALVIDEYGQVVGLVTLEDVLAELLGEVEALPVVESSGTRPERLPDGRVRLPGRLPLVEVERWLGVPWTGRADTVAGHVLEVHGRLPEPGQRLRVDGVEVEVEAVANQTVLTVLAQPETAAESLNESDGGLSTGGPA